MLAEFQLAKEALALHLLLQHLEGLVDIIVTDENLHQVFLCSSIVDPPNGHGGWATSARTRRKHCMIPYRIRPPTDSEKATSKKLRQDWCRRAAPVCEITALSPHASDLNSAF
jgi:hypothetical protein